VQEVVHEIGSHANGYTIHRDDIDVHIDSSTEYGDVTIDRHATGRDDVFTHPTATEAALREHFLQALTAR